MSVVVTSAATTAAVAAANSAAASARRQAQCDALMADYRHETATLEQQQAYAACVPAPPSDLLIHPKLAVALLLLAVPIGIVIAWQSLDGWMAGVFAAIGWVLMLLVLALVVSGVRFLFA